MEKINKILKPLGKIADKYSKLSYNLERLLFYSNQNVFEQHERNRKNEERFGSTGLEILATTWVPGVYLYKEVKKMRQSDVPSTSRYKLKRYGIIMTVELLLDVTRAVTVYAQYKLYQLL